MDAFSSLCLVVEFINGEKKVYDNPIGVMYYYSYNDMNLKSIDLKKMAASKIQKVKFIPISGEFSANDMTEKLADLK